MTSRALHFKGLQEVAEMIASGKTTSLCVTEQMLDRIAQVDTGYESYIHVCAERAREQAKAADADTAKGLHKGPLHEVLVQHRTDRPGEIRAVVLQIVHRVARRDGQHGVHQLAFEDLLKVSGPKRLAAKCLRRGRDALYRSFHPDVELCRHVHAQTVFCDD